MSEAKTLPNEADRKASRERANAAAQFAMLAPNFYPPSRSGEIFTWDPV